MTKQISSGEFTASEQVRVYKARPCHYLVAHIVIANA